MKNKSLFLLTVPAFLAVPFFAFAAAATFKDLIQQIIGILTNMMSLLFVAAFAAFFWGVAMFVLNTDDGKKRDEGRSWMKWSVIALFVMIALWSIVGILVSTFGLSANVIPQLPTK